MATCDTRGKSSRGPAAGGGTRPVTGRRNRGLRGLAAPRFAASDVTPCARADDMAPAARALPDYS